MEEPLIAGSPEITPVNDAVELPERSDAKKTHSSSWKKFKSYVFELTSPKNPLLEFHQKNGWKEKSYWSLEFLFPIVKLRADYSLYTFGRDLMAGAVIGILAILQVVIYFLYAFLVNKF